MLHVVYLEQVRDVYPHGATFYCDCGHHETIGVDRLAEIMFVGGWPKCCRRDMQIGDMIEEDEPCHA